jgi:membrane protein YqaA with SNARE-associated domain
MLPYFYLLVTAFISATVFPMGSEALFIYDLSIGLNLYLLLLFATIGNVLGSAVNYWFGLKGEEFLVDKSIIKESQIDKGKSYFDKYGAVCLLFSWLPIIGDSFTFIAGVLKYNFKLFILFTIISKSGRYTVLALVYYGVFS